MFVLNEKENLKYLTVSSFSSAGGVRHCFSTRYGGVSRGMYESMNLRFNCDDKRENVIKNFEILCGAVGTDCKNLILTKQVHEDNIEIVDKKDRGNGIFSENKFQSADGLICGEKNVPLAVFGADCLPVMFYDKKKKVIGVAHSGWRGTLKRITAKTVMKMRENFGSLPEDILAAIGPSIRVCHYEVSDELAESFEKEFGKETLLKFGEKYHIDMQKAVCMSLKEVGVKNITDCGRCTYCESDMYFSHRKTKGNRGVMAGIIELV